MRTELIRHINWRITRSMQNPFHMASYGTKLGWMPCAPFSMNEPQDNQTFQNKFHVWEDTETFQNVTKSPLPTHPLVLPQCHWLCSPPPNLRPVNGLSSNAGLIVVVSEWVWMNELELELKKPTNICHKDVQAKPDGSMLLRP